MTEGRVEWRRHWALPFVASMGIAGATLFPFVSGLLLVPLTHAQGWSRAQFSFAMLLQLPVGIFAGPFFARYVDRHGPRRVLLLAVPLAGFGLSLLGLVGHSIWQWWGLVFLLGILMAPVGPVGWMSAIILRFDAGRGLALAVALAGVGVGAAIWPVLGALALRIFGWRGVFPALGLGWALVLFPLAFATLPRGNKTRDLADDQQPRKIPIGPALRSRTTIFLTAAGAMFIIIIHGINLNLVPILSGLGYSLPQAAGIAGLAGVTAVAGRIITGLLLDYLPTRPLAIGAFLLPLATIALFLSATPAGWVTVAAVGLLGFSLGSETDIIAFIASRTFDRRAFASTYAVVIAVFSVCSALGPFLANRLYDADHSYRPFFLVAIPTILLGTVMIALVPDMKHRR